MSASDIDFGFECAKEMSYINKNFIDTDIAFNGKFLIEGLNIFKSKEISMYSEGNPSKAAIFTDEVETVLLMPLLLNN
jgi:DNA polymerase III sliding clamp (beta) subunit (PCNA family)